MTLPLQVALTVAPLACYFYVVGVWQSGVRARIVTGQVDFALLAFGVSGLVTIGPVGQVLMDLIFGDPTPTGWALWLLFLGVWTWIFSGTSRRRVVVYNIDPETLRAGLSAALQQLPDTSLTPTLTGFESTSAGLSLTLDASRRFRVGTIEARGPGAEAFIRKLREPLRTEIRRNPTGPSRVTWLMFGLSWLTMLAPMAVYLLSEPRAREAVRAFLMRVRG